MITPEKKKAMPENLEAMRKFSETYAKRSNTFFCVDPSVTSIVIEGLAWHKEKYGAPLCPCRHYEKKEAEVDKAYWNCPCVPMRERKECHCMLFLTKDNEFASSNQTIDLKDFISDN
jgi:ferredoxin-thioredoxin reductase catalytic chain